MGGDLPGQVGAGEHRPALPGRLQRGQEQLALLEPRQRRGGRVLPIAGGQDGLERVGKNVRGPGLVGGQAPRVLPGPFRGGGGGGRDAGRALQPVRSPADAGGLVGPGRVQRADLGMGLARAGLQDRGLDYRDSLGRREGAAEEFLVLGDFRTGFGVDGVGSFAPHREQFGGDSSDFGLAILIHVSELHS